MNPTQDRKAEAYDLFGKPLFAPELPADIQQKFISNLAKAEQTYRANPDDLDAIVWYSRRLGYLTRFQESLSVFSEGLERHPTSHVLLRFRGHRYISVRRFEDAIKDLERAAKLCVSVPDELEPDGEPNKAGIPTGTTRFNIYYHLGLAWYLLGQFERALPIYRTCMDYSTANNDALVATSDWLYMTLMRLGRREEAMRVLDPISEEMAILENEAYHRRLLLYKGLLTPEALMPTASSTKIDIVTQGYGVGNWYLCQGDTTRAKACFEAVLASPSWSGFGYIASECELKRGIHAGLVPTV